MRHVPFPLPLPIAHFMASEAYRVLSDSVRVTRVKPNKKKLTPLLRTEPACRLRQERQEDGQQGRWHRHGGPRRVLRERLWRRALHGIRLRFFFSALCPSFAKNKHRSERSR